MQTDTSTQIIYLRLAFAATNSIDSIARTRRGENENRRREVRNEATKGKNNQRNNKCTTHFTDRLRVNVMEIANLDFEAFFFDFV